MVRAGVALLTLIAPFAFPQPLAAQTREQKVRADRAKVEATGFWIYNDFARGQDEARKTGKPLLIALRCIPCEECVKIDDELVDNDDRVRPLLEQFVRVRLVSTNGLDLRIFQFDHDQSFAAFLMNADGAIYGRFGTRSHRTYWSDDVSIEGLAAALTRALELHADYPKHKDSLAGKTGPAPLFPRPEEYPTLRGKYRATLSETGNVVASCIHCHQIGDAAREFHRASGNPMPEDLLFPFPHPKRLGLVIDPRTCGTLREVTPDSVAAEAGLRRGDEIVALGEQPVLSIADIQWVLHHIPADGGQTTARVRRAGKETTLTLTLPPGWRRLDNISWRASTWGLRRMALGGLVLFDPEVHVDDADAPEPTNGLRVQHVGQYGAHAAAKKAGFIKGDILLSFDGRDDFTRETDLLAHALTRRKPGEVVPVVVERGGKRLKLTLPMQK